MNPGPEYYSLTIHLCLALLTGWFAVLFIQSGIDKITDWKGNLEWLTGHFSKSPLRNFVPQMLATVTVTETLAGFGAAAGLFLQVFASNPTLSFWAFGLGNLNLLMLFFGQRISKDYAGAATLQSYFIVGLMGMLLSGMMAAGMGR